MQLDSGMQRPACVSCLIKAQDANAALNCSAASVLVFGHTKINQTLQELTCRAHEHFVPGVTSYCAQCRTITMLATHSCPVSAMIEHELKWQVWHPAWSAFTKS